ATSETLEGYGNALLGVTFVRSSGMRQRLKSLPVLLKFMQSLPQGVQGRQEVSVRLALRRTVHQVRIYRGDFVGPVFQVDAGTFVQDPVLSRLEGKFAKRYQTDAPPELLAYYEHQPTQRVEFTLQKVQRFIEQRISASPFSRVWVFDM